MILVKKNKEPKEWKKFRNTKGAQYESKPELVDALLKEQGYLCAYCMRTIPCTDNYIKVVNGQDVPQVFSERYRIEHIKSRSQYPELQLDYQNMVICCPGHIGDEAHCDRSKDNSMITLSPLDPNTIRTVSYASDGTIKSSNATFDQEMNGILHLNTALLKANRAKALAGLIEYCTKAGFQAHVLEKCLKDAETMHQESSREGGVTVQKAKLSPYCGIVIYYLQKKLRQMNSVKRIV